MPTWQWTFSTKSWNCRNRVLFTYIFHGLNCEAAQPNDQTTRPGTKAHRRESQLCHLELGDGGDTVSLCHSFFTQLYQAEHFRMKSFIMWTTMFETQKWPTNWLIPQIPTKARAWPGQNQKPRTKSRSLTAQQGLSSLSCHLLSPK